MMVNLKLGDKCDQDEFSTRHERGGGQRKKNLSPRRESKPWPPEHRAVAPSTELREPMESEAI